MYIFVFVMCVYAKTCTQACIHACTWRAEFSESIPCWTTWSLHACATIGPRPLVYCTAALDWVTYW